MKLMPDYQLNVFPEETFREEMAAADKILAQHRQEGTFRGFDGRPLYYEYYQVQQSKGSVVVLHGLSEFTVKFREFAWYLLNQGYDVFLYDHRGHGRSCRQTERLDLIHVDRFPDYQKDLDCFLEQVVKKAAAQGPLYLYGHSMGGAVALQQLGKRPDMFRKAVLSAPMIEPKTGGVPMVVARSGLFFVCLFGGKKKKFWRASEFDPNHPFSQSQDQSLARYQRNMENRRAEECYRTTPITNSWAYHSIGLKRKFTSKRFLSKLRTPILMICAETDRVVSGEAQEEFARKCPTCRRTVIPESAHSLLGGTSETLRAYVQLVVDHFG